MDGLKDRSGRELTAAELVTALANRDYADAQQLRAKIPRHADVLIAYATTPGYVSWRNSLKGSWFVQALCQVFAKHAKDEDLLSMLTRVSRAAAEPPPTYVAEHAMLDFDRG